MSTQQRVAIVTGGGRGIGRAIVLGLLRAGFSVAAVDRDRAPLDELASEADGRAALLALPADISTAEACANVVATVRERLGPVAVLVNNAGIGQGSIRQDN